MNGCDWGGSRHWGWGWTLCWPVVPGQEDRTTIGQPASFGRAKSCIVLFMFGAPAHQDSWDMKPDAPSEVRSEFSPIPSAVPGISVCEHLPLLARHTSQLAQLRSVTHPDNTHTVAMHYMLTGMRHRRPRTNPQNAADDFPCFGAVANHVGGRDSAGGLPPGISLNARQPGLGEQSHLPGFFGGFLGPGSTLCSFRNIPTTSRSHRFPRLTDPRGCWTGSDCCPGLMARPAGRSVISCGGPG